MSGQWSQMKSMISGRRTSDDKHLHCGNAPRTIPLLLGGEDEAGPILSNATAAADTTNYIFGAQSWKLSTAGAVTAYAIWDPISPSDPFPVGAASIIFLAIYLPSGGAAKLTSFTPYVYMDSACSKSWSRTILSASLADGWNYINLKVNDGLTSADAPSWGNVYRIKYSFVTSDALDISVQMWALARPKGQILLIDDGPYTSFAESFYPMLRARGIPVEFAIDPADMGVTTRMSWSTLASLMADGNGNAVTLHGYQSTTDDNSTAALLRTNTLKALKEVSARGYYSMWRGAFLQNTAAGHAGIDNMFPAYATYSGANSSETWPSSTVRGLNRISIHGSSSANIDEYFNRLKYTHNLYILYTHGVTADGSASDTSFAQRDYFLSKVDTGLSEGWLEFVTFPRLAAELGWRWEQDLAGRRCITVPAADGTITRYYQP